MADRIMRTDVLHSDWLGYIVKHSPVNEEPHRDCISSVAALLVIILKCSSCYCFQGRVIVPVVCFLVLSKGSEPFR